MNRNYLIIIVLIFFVSCEEIINEQNIESDEVTVIAPSQRSTVASGSVSFDWEPIDGASSYRIQIATPNFQQAAQVVVDSATSVTRESFPLDAGSYQWRVRAENSAYVTDYVVIDFEVE